MIIVLRNRGKSGVRYSVGGILAEGIRSSFGRLDDMSTGVITVKVVVLRPQTPGVGGRGRL